MKKIAFISVLIFIGSAVNLSAAKKPSYIQIRNSIDKEIQTIITYSKKKQSIISEYDLEYYRSKIPPKNEIRFEIDLYSIIDLENWEDDKKNFPIKPIEIRIKYKDTNLNKYQEVSYTIDRILDPKKGVSVVFSLGGGKKIKRNSNRLKKNKRINPPNPLIPNLIPDWHWKNGGRRYDIKKSGIKSINN